MGNDGGREDRRQSKKEAANKEGQEMKGKPD